MRESVPGSVRESVPESGAWPGIAKAVVLAAVLIGAGVALQAAGPAFLHALHPNAAGAVWLVGLGAVMVALGVPRQALAFAGGFLFGVAGGVALSLLGQMIGCAMDYYAAGFVAGDWAQARLRRGRVFTAMERLLARPFVATLGLRLLPVGNNVALNLLAGVLRLPRGRFFAASALGYAPQTVIFALLGSGVELGRGTRLGLGAALFVVSMALGLVLVLRQGGRKPVSTDD